MITHNHSQQHLLPLLFLLSVIPFFSSTIFAIDLVFNGFNSSDVLLFGNATIDSRILTLTHQQHFSIGRALYNQRVITKKPNSSYVYPFSTSFIFSMAPYKDTLPGHGLVFIFTPVTGIRGTSSAQHLGLFNLTNNGNVNNHVFGVEFDVFMNQEFNDINANHVGIDLNSLTSFASHDAGYWPEGVRKNDDEKKNSFKELKLNNGENYQVWIDYEDSLINVTMVKVGMRRPTSPLLNVSINLSQVFEDEMFVGFTSATGQLVESHKILAWSFSNTNFSLSKELVTTGLPSFVLPKDSIFKSKRFVAGFTIGVFFIICLLVLLGLFLIQRRRMKRLEMEDWELEYWPHRMTYEEIEAATKGFSEENVIGVGGNGKVFKGVLKGGAEIAVKRISHENDGLREFLSEISSLGRLKHRNLVGLRGWCKKDVGNFLLVYDYMENGSLDKRVFGCDDERKMLNFEERIRIIKDVAFAVLYLHEGWEVEVIHRDIKASNVLLDKDMNGRLGDFGLARMHSHGQVPGTTKLVGTVGYMAPEIIRTGRASTHTDVYMFGIMILEVLCGRRPIEEGKKPLVEWVWEKMVQGELVNALDERLRFELEEFNNKQEVEKVLHLGLLCTYPEPNSRPTMRQVVSILEGKIEGEESENENMDISLLQQLNSSDILAGYSQYFNFLAHPTFEDIRGSHTSSVSLTWSKSIVEDGR